MLFLVDLYHLEENVVVYVDPPIIRVNNRAHVETIIVGSPAVICRCENSDA